MHDPSLAICPKCGGRTEPAFSMHNAPLSFISAGDVARWIHADTDLNNRGTNTMTKVLHQMRTLLPGPAEYLLSYLCPRCHLYMVQCDELYSSTQAKELAKELLPRN